MADLSVNLLAVFENQREKPTMVANARLFYIHIIVDVVLTFFYNVISCPGLVRVIQMCVEM